MNRKEFERARSRLWARLYSLTLRDEVVGDREDISGSLRIMRLHAAADREWAGKVEWLSGEVAKLPIFSRNSKEHADRSYEPIIAQLVEWGYTLGGAEAN
ncbi:MAG TPA: hypothetical protein VGE76_19785 [Opitutaceae bacterium]